MVTAEEQHLAIGEASEIRANSSWREVSAKQPWRLSSLRRSRRSGPGGAGSAVEGSRAVAIGREPTREPFVQTYGLILNDTECRRMAHDLHSNALE
jgi:hypothetical protein